MPPKPGYGKCLDGMVFGRLTVLREGPRRETGKRSRRQAICQCSCDAKTIRLVSVDALTTGHTTSCGCQAIDSAHARKCSFDGQVFGRLTVLRDAAFRRAGDRNRMVLCRCACGVEKVIALSSLQKKLTTSCGCYNREYQAEHSTTHGHTKGGKFTPEYHTWAGMIARCSNAALPEYKNYGGRGIKVCPEWSSFENFFRDMGPRPKDHSIERVDVNGNYEPGNVVWATRTQQARNKRNTVYVEYGGAKIPMATLADMAGMTYSKLHDRLYLLGWSVEKAVADSPLLWEL